MTCIHLSCKKNQVCVLCVCIVLCTADPVDVLVEREQELLPVHRPHFDGLVVRGCDQSLSVTGEVNAAHSRCVSPENC